MPGPSSRQPPPPQQQDNKRDRAPQPTEEPEEHNPNKRGRQEPIPPPEPEPPPEPPPTPLVGRSQHGPMWQKNGMGEQVEYSVEKGRLDKYGWLYDSSLFLGLLNPGLFCGCTVCILQLWVGQQLLPLPQQQNTEHKWVLQQKEESEESNPNKRGQLEQIPQPELEPPPSRGRLWYGAQRLKKEM
uniref:Repellent protein 1 n=1 Tax=Anthurium amnicola TaxID=1678845 RepID=A0A1D1Z931_9ARAE